MMMCKRFAGFFMTIPVFAMLWISPIVHLLGSVSELLLNSNGLEDKSAEAIAELLKTNNTVKLLWIPSNKFTYFAFNFIL
jgi:hypothetical protein